MGLVRLPRKVLLLTAVCYHESMDIDGVEKKLVDLFGPINEKTVKFKFNHTQYYQDEMGQNLYKYYITFSDTISPARIADIKLTTNQIEQDLSQSGARIVNIDPGYIEVPKLVLATTKNFSHRIYLDKGIYGDVQLVWQGGTFRANPWTYPDYYDPENLKFFIRQRQQYFKNLQKEIP